MKISGIRAIIFDLGGTLYKPETDLLQVTSEFLHDKHIMDPKSHSGTRINEVVAEQDKWLENYMVENNVPADWQPTHDIWLEYDRRLLSALGVTEDIDRLAKEYQARCGEVYDYSNPVLFDGVKPALETMHDRGLRLAIASNRYTYPIRRLKHDSIDHLFDVIEFTNVPGYMKPSPYMLLLTAAKLGLNPMRCAYVGNIADTDLVAAQRAQMLPVLLTWCNPEEVGKVSVDAIVIEHIAELLDVLY